jgi:hypothetical protein
MPSPYRRFDRDRLLLKPLAEREHLLDLSVLLKLDERPPEAPDPRIRAVADAILTAQRREAPVILMMGAHLLRAGVARYLIRMMEEGIINHLAMNGAGPIHDFEMALIGATTESVGRYIEEGQFGLWTETGAINAVVARAAAEGLGFGEALGRAICDGPFPYKEISVLAAGYRLGVPVTVHAGIGYDIIHEHPSCDGAALGQASYEDFLIFAESVSHLEGGALLNFGSAVMGPEVFLKALAMARNVAHQEGRRIERFTTAVFDILDLGEETEVEPPRHDPHYYFRPYKTLLVRTVQAGGRGLYIQGEHRQTFPCLYRTICSLQGKKG